MPGAQWPPLLGGRCVSVCCCSSLVLCCQLVLAAACATVTSGLLVCRFHTNPLSSWRSTSCRTQPSVAARVEGHRARRFVHLGCLAEQPGLDAWCAVAASLRRQVRFCLLLLLSCPLLPTCARRCLCNGDLWFACLPVSNDHLESFSRFGLPVRVLRDSGGLSLDCRWTGCGWTMGAWLAKFS